MMKKHTPYYFLACMTLTVLLACRKEDEKASIRGIVIESPGGASVPFARVTIGKEEYNGSSVAHYTVTDTLTADEQGAFCLDGEKYHHFREECGCGFVAVASGPSELYSSDNQRTHFYNPVEPIVCTVGTMGYIRVTVQDLPPYVSSDEQVDQVSVNVLGQYGAIDGSLVYPDPDFNLENGAMYGPLSYGSEVEIKLLFNSTETGILSELSQLQSIVIPSKDTVVVHFDF